MHEQTSRDVYANDQHGPAIGIIQIEPVDVWVHGWLHRVVTDSADPTFNSIQTIKGNAEHLSGIVVHSQDHHPALRVGEGGQFVREVVRARADDAGFLHQDTPHLQSRVLAKPDASHQFGIGHAVSPLLKHPCRVQHRSQDPQRPANACQEAGSTGGQLSLQVGKCCLFEIKAVLNDPFDPRIHTLLTVQTSEKCGSRGKRFR